jgi:hypothetical protein
MNTLCPKLGAAQWSCSAAECVCHLKAAAQLREMRGKPIPLNTEPYCPFCRRCHPGGDTCMGHYP